MPYTDVVFLSLSSFTVEPGFYPTNWLFIGKCHLQLGKVEEGSKWLIKIATHQSSISDDIEVRREGGREGERGREREREREGGEREGGGHSSFCEVQTRLYLY